MCVRLHGMLWCSRPGSACQFLSLWLPTKSEYDPLLLHTWIAVLERPRLGQEPQDKGIRFTASIARLRVALDPNRKGLGQR